MADNSSGWCSFLSEISYNKYYHKDSCSSNGRTLPSAPPTEWWHALAQTDWFIRVEDNDYAGLMLSWPSTWPPPLECKQDMAADYQQWHESAAMGGLPFADLQRFYTTTKDGL